MPRCGCSVPAEVAQPHTSTHLWLCLGPHKGFRCQQRPSHDVCWQAELEGSYLLSPLQRLTFPDHKTRSKFNPLPDWDLSDPYPQQRSCEVSRPQTRCMKTDTELSLLSDWVSAGCLAGSGWGGHVATRPMDNPSSSLSRGPRVLGTGKGIRTHKAGSFLLSTSSPWVNHFEAHLSLQQHGETWLSSSTDGNDGGAINGWVDSVLRLLGSGQSHWFFDS